MIYKKKYRLYKSLTILLSALLVLSLAVFAFLLGNKSKQKTVLPENSSSESSSFEASEIVTETETEATSADTTEDVTSAYIERIDELEALIEKYEAAYADELSVKAECMAELLELLAVENRPLRSHIDDEGEPTGELTPAEVAFCYTDLTTGAVFSYNADKIMYSASLIKAPYVYAMLKAAATFEYNKLNFSADGSPLYTEDGSPLFEGKHPNLDAEGNIIYLDGEEKYDLSKTWVYNSSTMFVEGSGEIQKKDDGFTLTYLELACYALKYSDNIAFSEIIKHFGLNEHNEMLEILGIAGAEKGFMQLSAADCAKYLTEIYKFCEGDSKYAAAMKEAMLSAPYTVMIPAAMSPIPCAHKYGWDIGAYHDMAIVYDERPFSLVIMTDLDRGQSADYIYIQNIAKVMLKLHQGNGELT